MTLDFTDMAPREHDGTHITPSQVKQLERYVRKVLGRLDLGYWRVLVAKDLPPADALLMIEPTDGRRIAMLYVSEGWWDRDAEEKRTDITHECLHLAHHDQEAVIRRWKDSTGDVAEYVLSLLWEQFRLETERMVDSLSYVLAPQMPRWKS